jgi:hypothetical protein
LPTKPSKTANILWGKARVDQKFSDYYRNTTISWLATEPNELAVRGYTNAALKRGDKDAAAATKKIAYNLMMARDQTQKFFVEKAVDDSADNIKSAADIASGDRDALSSPVYVIVPGQCASPCLDALDFFKLFSNTILIGAPSSADSTYMDIRVEPLPSDYGVTDIPMKIWVNRPRANGEFYKPDIPVNDFDSSTANFLKRIEEDLAKRKHS